MEPQDVTWVMFENCFAKTGLKEHLRCSHDVHYCKMWELLLHHMEYPFSWVYTYLLMFCNLSNDDKIKSVRNSVSFACAFNQTRDAFKCFQFVATTAWHAKETVDLSC